jgi:hypothetical protein
LRQRPSPLHRQTTLFFPTLTNYKHYRQFYHTQTSNTIVRKT